jgi:hypothetical protein
VPSSPSFRSKSNVIITGDGGNLIKIATNFQSSAVSPWFSKAVPFSPDPFELFSQRQERS